MTVSAEEFLVRQSLMARIERDSKSTAFARFTDKRFVDRFRLGQKYFFEPHHDGYDVDVDC